MGEPGYEKNCIQNESKPETGCDPFGKLTPQFSLPLSLTDEEKRIMIEVIENVNLPKEVEERGALSSTVINTLLGVVFKSRINFAIGKAVRHVGLHCLGTAVKKTLAWMVIKLKKAWDLGTLHFTFALSLTCSVVWSVPRVIPLSLLWAAIACLPLLGALALSIKNWSSKKASWMKKSPLCHTWLLAKMIKSAKPLLSWCSDQKILSHFTSKTRVLHTSNFSRFIFMAQFIFREFQMF